MGNLKFDYIFLSLLLYLAFIILGNITAKNYLKNSRSSYWPALLIPTLIYSLVEGLRYARGVDYGFYSRSYLAVNTSTSTGQPIFDFLNFSMNVSGLPAYGAFIIYSLILIIGIFVFLKDYRELAAYTFPFFLAATVTYSETFVRQFVAMAFVFIALKAALKNNWVLYAVFALCALLTHSVTIFLLGIIVLQLLVIRKPINTNIAIVIYVFIVFFFDASNIATIIPYLQRITLSGIGSHFQSYIESANMWFSKDAIKDIYKQNIFTKTANVLFDISLIYAGGQAIKKQFLNTKPIILFYNLFVFGAWTFQAFFSLEILRRFALAMYLFWFMLAAYIFVYFPLNKKSTPLIKASQIIILAYVVALVLRYIFGAEDQLFIWDS